MINWFILKKKTGKNRNKFGKIKRTRLRFKKKKKPSMWMVDGGVCKRQKGKKRRRNGVANLNLVDCVEKQRACLLR